MKQAFCTTGVSGVRNVSAYRSAYMFEGFVKLTPHTVITHENRSVSCDNIQINRWNTAFRVSENITNKPLDTVPRNSRSGFFRYGDSEPCITAVICSPHYKYSPTRIAVRRMCQSEKFWTFSKTYRGWKGIVTVGTHQSNQQELFCSNADRKIFSAFCSSTLDYKTTVFCCHTDKKSVCSFTGNITWLICSFHAAAPLSEYLQ